MTDQKPDDQTPPRFQEAEDPGAYIGNRPEREAETIPGGVDPRDERISATESRPGQPGEPDEVPTADTTDESSGDAAPA